MPTFLVVDDAAFMRMRSVKLLNENGWETIEAVNDVEPVAMYQREHPDGVLMDITMPEMDRLEALGAILAIDQHARVAMVTTVGQQQVVMEALKAGARLRGQSVPTIACPPGGKPAAGATLTLLPLPRPPAAVATPATAVAGLACARAVLGI
jgi:two-component system chemotaxis response regulator CheY